MKSETLKKTINISTKTLIVYSAIIIAFSSLFVLLQLSAWILTPFVIIGFLLIPGFLIALNLNLSYENKLEYFIYCLSLGLCFLIIGGLLINYILPFLGILKPLSAIPVVVFIDTVFIALSVFYYSRKKIDEISFEIGNLEWANILFAIIPVFFVFMSVVGAKNLNNFGSGNMTISMLVFIAVYFLALFNYGKNVPHWIYATSIYLISLSLLLMYSLRSGHILGWDINEEYQVFATTLENLRWKMSVYPNLDYNSCISITIFPTILKVLTRVPAEYIFKFTTQLLFAITPVITFVFSKRFLNKRLSFLAAFLVLSQTWFFEQLPALIRQEIAFIIYFSIVFVLFDKNMSVKTKNILFYFFTTTLVVSHYSTAYIWVALMSGILLLSLIGKYFIKDLRNRPLFIKPLMIVVTIVLLVIWEGPITHTANALQKFTKKSTAVVVSNEGMTNAPISTTSIPSVGTATLQALNPVSPNSLKDTILKLLFISHKQSTNKGVSQAQEEVFNKFYHAGDLYDDPGLMDSAPQELNDQNLTENKLSNPVSKVLGIVFRISKLLFVNIFTLLGFVLIYRSFRKEKNYENFDFFIFNICAILLVIIMVLVPYLQVYYNLTRLFLQMFLVVSIFAVMGSIAFTKFFGKFQFVVISIMLASVFLLQSGVYDEVSGGKKRITLDLPPADYDNYYIYDRDVAGARWLKENKTNNMPVQSDVMANLRLQSFGNFDADNLNIFPATIRKDSYVYLISINTSEEKAYYHYLNNTLVYKYPIQFLNTHKDLIYDNGGSRIYK